MTNSNRTLETFITDPEACGRLLASYRSLTTIAPLTLPNPTMPIPGANQQRPCRDAMTVMADTWPDTLAAVTRMTWQVIRYNTGRGMAQHHDAQGGNRRLRRVLSCSIQLSEPDDYTDGDLYLWPDGPDHDPTVLDRHQGAGCVFRSPVFHQVDGVTAGTRFSLVGWLWAPPDQRPDPQW